MASNGSIREQMKSGSNSAGVRNPDLIAGYDTTPESDVRMTLALGGLAFYIKILYGGGRGN